MDCGPACVCMVADHFGKEYPLSYLRAHSHLSRDGVSIAGIRESLKYIGIQSASFNVNNEQLREKFSFPVILHWEQNHFVVLYQVKWSWWKRKWLYSVANPAYGKHTFTEDTFNSYLSNNY